MSTQPARQAPEQYETPVKKPRSAEVLGPVVPFNASECDELGDEPEWMTRNGHEHTRFVPSFGVAASDESEMLHGTLRLKLANQDDKIEQLQGELGKLAGQLGDWDRAAVELIVAKFTELEHHHAELERQNDRLDSTVETLATELAEVKAQRAWELMQANAQTSKLELEITKLEVKFKARLEERLEQQCVSLTGQLEARFNVQRAEFQRMFQEQRESFETEKAKLSEAEKVQPKVDDNLQEEHAALNEDGEALEEAHVEVGQGLGFGGRLRTWITG